MVSKSKECVTVSGWKKNFFVGEIDFSFISNPKTAKKKNFNFFSKIEKSDRPFFIKSTDHSLQLKTYLENTIPLSKSQSFKSTWIKHFSKKQSDQKQAEKLLTSLSLEKVHNRIPHSVVIIQAQQYNQDYQLISNLIAKKNKLPTGLNIYLTPKNDQTFPKHFDPHDVYVLQISGSKKWRIYDYSKEKKQECVILEIVLNPGDFLFIPKGFLHEALALQEMSVHFTFGVYEMPKIPLEHFLYKYFNKSVVEKLNEVSAKHFLHYLKHFDLAKTNKQYFIFKNLNEDSITLVTRSKMLKLPIGHQKEIMEILKENQIKNLKKGKNLKILKEMGIIK